MDFTLLKANIVSCNLLATDLNVFQCFFPSKLPVIFNSFIAERQNSKLLAATMFILLMHHLAEVALCVWAKLYTHHSIPFCVPVFQVAKSGYDVYTHKRKMGHFKNLIIAGI